MAGVLLDEKCPRCGDSLVIREGRGHSFLGCLSFPDCRYTRSIKEGEELKLYQPPPEFCSKCNHTGLIPFIKPDGSVSRYAKVFCECRAQAQHEYSYPIKPADIDFPCSYTMTTLTGRTEPLDIGTLPTMEAIIVDGKVINHEALKRFYAERHRRQEIIRAGMFADMETMNSEALEPPEPVEPQPIRQAQDKPWQKDQWQSVQQYLDKQVKEALAKKKAEQNYEPF